MRLRTFTAPDMPSAMQMVREAMGDEAIIISTKEGAGAKKSISVTAAIDGGSPEESATQTSQAEAAASLRFELQGILRFHNVPELFIAKMLQKLADRELASITDLHKISGSRDPKQMLKLALEKMLSGFFGFDPLPLDKNNVRLMLVGAPGIGKTLTVAKIAARMTMDKQPLSVITTDNKRAGGFEQLHAFTSILGLELKQAESPAELARHLKLLPARTNVLIDTAGYNPYDASEVREMRGYASTDGIEPVLVMQAGSDSMEAIDMIEAFTALPVVKRLLVTRADTSRRFGGVLAAAATHGMAFCNISHSASIADTLPAADPALLAQMLLRYQQ